MSPAPVDGPRGGPAVATGAAMVAARVPLGAHVQLYHIHDFRQSQKIPDSRNRTPKETKLARLGGGGIGGSKGRKGTDIVLRPISDCPCAADDAR